MLFIESYIKDEVLKEPNLSLLEASFETLDSLLESTEDSGILNEGTTGFGGMILRVKALLLKASQNILIYAIKLKEKVRTYLNKVFVNEKTVKKDEAKKKVDDFVVGKYGLDSNNEIVDYKDKLIIRINIPSVLLNLTANDFDGIIKGLQSNSYVENDNAIERVETVISRNNDFEKIKKDTSAINIDRTNEIIELFKSMSKDIYLATMVLFKRVNPNRKKDDNQRNDIFIDPEKSINALLKLSNFLTKLLMLMLVNFEQSARIG
jgi:hypothetical protein